jgi:hypothetical protein
MTVNISETPVPKLATRNENIAMTFGGWPTRRLMACADYLGWEPWRRSPFFTPGRIVTKPRLPSNGTALACAFFR